MSCMKFNKKGADNVGLLLNERLSAGRSMNLNEMFMIIYSCFIIKTEK